MQTKINDVFVNLNRIELKGKEQQRDNLRSNLAVLTDDLSCQVSCDLPSKPIIVNTQLYDFNALD